MDSDSEDEYLGNGTPAPVLKLIENPTLHECKIDHIRLGDDGCRRLFRWLKTGTDWSDEQDNNSDYKREVTPIQGFPRSLSHLELTGVRMGDAGFEYLVDWLRYLSLQGQVRKGVLDRPMLKTLILRSNKVQGSFQSAKDFISVSSSLVSLGLSNNPLSAVFRKTLFPLLPKQRLRILDLSLTQIELSDVGALASYIGDTSTKCKLTQFIANANSMEYPGIKTLITSIENCWTLEKVDMFGNVTGQDFNREEEMQQNLADLARCEERIQADFLVSVHSAMNLTWGSGCGHIGLETRLKLILGRNIILKQRVKSQALDLLKYSRVMLYNRAKSPAPASASQETSSCSEECECVPIESNRPLSASSKLPQRAPFFTELPTELQLSILSEIAPILSPGQKIRIFEYATDKTTLPKLQLCLPNRRLHYSKSDSSKTCVVDPTGLAFNTNFSGSLSLHGKKAGNLSSASREAHRKNSCAGGNCFGSHSVVCRRQIELQEWLELVECDAYDPGDTISG